MTVPQARMLQERYTDLHPVMRSMDVSYRIAGGKKGLWASSAQPKQVSAEKPEAVHPLMSETLKRLGWTPPAAKQTDK